MADGNGTAAKAGTVGQRRPARPIATYLLILALVALIPAFVFSAILLQNNNEAQARVVETLITGNARAIVQAVDREINANVTTLRVLATTSTLLDGDLGAFHVRVTSALRGTGSYIFLVDRNLVSYFTTRLPFDQQPQTPITDQATAKQAFDSGEVAVSGAVLGRLSKSWGVNILLPLFPVGREPLLIGFSRDAGQFAGAFPANRMPEGWKVALVDANGTVIAASEGGGAAGEPFTVASPETLGSTPGWRIVRNSTESNYVVIQRSLLSGWSVVAWASTGMVERPFLLAFGSLVFGGLLLAALVALVIYWVSLQIGRSVQHLASDAKRLGSGQPVEARPYPIAEIETVSEALGEASKRRQSAETEVRFLMRELAHRSKNQMTVIAAMAKQTARGADSVPEFVSSFEKRIFGLARSTDLLLAHGVAGVDLKELLTSQIDPFCPVDGDRVIVDGPPTRINPQAAQIIGMAAHELATNAVKYGAFARDGGRLAATWTREADSIAFRWRERGARLGTGVHRRGFGTTVLENMVGRSLGAQVERLVHEDGIEWAFRIPMIALDPTSSLNGRFEPQQRPVQK